MVLGPRGFLQGRIKLPIRLRGGGGELASLLGINLVWKRGKSHYGSNL